MIGYDLLSMYQPGSMAAALKRKQLQDAMQPPQTIPDPTLPPGFSLQDLYQPWPKKGGGAQQVAQAGGAPAGGGAAGPDATTNPAAYPGNASPTLQRDPSGLIIRDNPDAPPAQDPSQQQPEDLMGMGAQGTGGQGAPGNFQSGGIIGSVTGTSIPPDSYPDLEGARKDVYDYLRNTHVPNINEKQYQPSLARRIVGGFLGGLAATGDTRSAVQQTHDFVYKKFNDAMSAYETELARRMQLLKHYQDAASEDQKMKKEHYDNILHLAEAKGHEATAKRDEAAAVKDIADANLADERAAKTKWEHSPEGIAVAQQRFGKLALPNEIELVDGTTVTGYLVPGKVGYYTVEDPENPIPSAAIKPGGVHAIETKPTKPPAPNPFNTWLPAARQDPANAGLSDAQLVQKFDQMTAEERAKAEAKYGPKTVLSPIPVIQPDTGQTRPLQPGGVLKPGEVPMTSYTGSETARLKTAQAQKDAKAANVREFNRILDYENKSTGPGDDLVILTFLGMIKPEAIGKLRGLQKSEQDFILNSRTYGQSLQAWKQKFTTGGRLDPKQKKQMFDVMRSIVKADYSEAPYTPEDIVSGKDRDRGGIR